MKKFIKLILTAVLSASLLLSCGILSGCGNSKTIRVCASDIPHAQILEECVKDVLAKDGWKLKIEFLDWTIQNNAVANGDYDANYFQHVPYLNNYKSSTKLFASCKVHYEPLGIYYGKATAGTPVTSGTTFAICDDVSNAIRAFDLLEAKGVISKTIEGNNYPVNADGKTLKIKETETTWTSVTGLTVTLVAENLLVSSLDDYDFACLPCNTAFTGNVDVSKRAEMEGNADLPTLNANIIAARENEYNTNEVYKAKIDALTNAMLSKEVRDFINEKYNGIIICDDTTQIDLR